MKDSLGKSKTKKSEEKIEQNKGHHVIWNQLFSCELIFFKHNHVLKWRVVMFLYKKNKSNYPLLPNLSLPKNFFQITLNKGHPHTKSWHNFCICFIWMVVHHYKNIYKKEEMVISRKEKEKQNVNKKKWNKLWMKHYSKILVWNNHHITFWAFNIIYIHTPNFGNDTSLIKSTQIKDWLFSFKGFNLEENFDLLTDLF